MNTAKNGGKTMWWDREKSDIKKPKREACNTSFPHSSQKEPSLPDLGLRLLTSVRNNPFLWFKVPSLWHFVTAAEKPNTDNKARDGRSLSSGFLNYCWIKALHWSERPILDWYFSNRGNFHCIKPLNSEDLFIITAKLPNIRFN